MEARSWPTRVTRRRRHVTGWMAYGVSTPSEGMAKIHRVPMQCNTASAEGTRPQGGGYVWRELVRWLSRPCDESALVHCIAVTGRWLDDLSSDSMYR